MEGIEIYKLKMDINYFKEKNIESIIIGSCSSQDEIYKNLKLLEDNEIKIYRLFR